MPRIDEGSRNRRVPGPGYSVLGASKETDIPEGRIRRAVRNGEIKVVKFGGTERIPKSEVEKLKLLYA